MSVKRYERVEVLVNQHAQLGEGPRWDHRNEILAWVDILGKQVHLTDVGTGLTTTTSVGTEVGALALYGDTGYLLALGNGFAPLIDGELGQHDEVFAGDALRMNDAVVDPVGRLVAGSMARGAHSEMGSLYVREADGGVRTLFGGVTISNGIAWSKDSKLMYYVDSPLQTIDIMDYDPGSGSVSERRTWVDIPTPDGTPDGITIDAEGCIWVALWGGSKVQRFSPEGQLVGEVELPVPQVTACGFGGPDLDRLFITTAAVGRAASDDALDGALFVVEPGCRGVQSVVVPVSA